MLTSFQRKLKQADIALAYLVFPLAIAAFVWYFAAIPSSEGEIKSIEIGKVEASIKTKEKPWEAPFTYIVSVSVKNPNEKFFLEKINYLFEIKDESGKSLVKKEETIEIKENEDKKIKDELAIEKRGKNLSFEITGAEWKRVSERLKEMEKSEEPEKSKENEENTKPEENN